MKALNVMIKTEAKLAIRCMDSIIFGIFFPMGVALLLGIIYGSKPAHLGTNYTFLQQSFGAVAAIGICATGLMGIPLSVSDYRHKKILKRYQVTPVSPTMLLFTQVIIQISLSIISSLGVYVILKIFFGYHMIGFIGSFLLAYLLVVMAIYGIGMMIASISPNMKTANLLCTIIYFPMVFLSGATIPYEIMPKAMQKITNILPLTQGIKLMKGTSLGLLGNDSIVQIGVLVTFAFMSILLSLKFFRWE